MEAKNISFTSLMVTKGKKQDQEPLHGFINTILNPHQSNTTRKTFLQKYALEKAHDSFEFKNSKGESYYLQAVGASDVKKIQNYKTNPEKIAELITSEKIPTFSVDEIFAGIRNLSFDVFKLRFTDKKNASPIIKKTLIIADKSKSGNTFYSRYYNAAIDILKEDPSAKLTKKLKKAGITMNYWIAAKQNLRLI